MQQRWTTLSSHRSRKIDETAYQKVLSMSVQLFAGIRNAFAQFVRIKLQTFFSPLCTQHSSIENVTGTDTISPPHSITITTITWTHIYTLSHTCIHTQCKESCKKFEEICEKMKTSGELFHKRLQALNPQSPTTATISTATNSE